MNNKLGLDGYNFERVEKELVKKKFLLLDEMFTFNEQKYNLDFLNKLNEFLFRDIYYDEDLGLRNLKDSQIKLLEKRLELIVNICVFNPQKNEQILYLISQIWDIQPFNTGNTRTLIGFLKILSSAFLLNIDIDLDKNIKSNSEIFQSNDIVNQKRLTKNN